MSTETAYFGYEQRLEERLRSLNIYLDGKWEHPAVCSEAADEIERLRLERDTWMAAYKSACEIGKARGELNAELVAAVGPSLEDAEIWLRKRNESTPTLKERKDG